MTTRTGLASAIRRHIRHDGENPTAVPGLVLYTRQQAMSRMPGIYRPSICFVAQGSKRMYYGEYCRHYDPDNYLISSLMLPAEAEIRDVSPDRPFLALILDIDRPLVSRLMLEIDARLPGTAAPVTTDICVSTPVTERLRDSVARLLDLLDDPLDCAVLSPGVLCEIYYEVLRGPHGNLLRNCVRNDARANRIAPIVHYIEENYHRPLGIGAIARVAGMIPSSLHQYFRQATSMSPMQFVKSLRLHQARMLLLSGNPANAASYQVGYNSPSQFSREFKRFFGDRPSQVRATSAG
jgi:AraC-like DNA-binding protein